MKNKTILMIGLTILLFAFCTDASTVTRHFSPAYIDPYGNVNVTLSVDITTSEGFYIIDEILPPFMTISDAGTGNTAEIGHIKWFVMSGVTDTNLTYTLDDNQSVFRNITFNGTYILLSESANEYKILGDYILKSCTPNMTNSSWDPWINISSCTGYIMTQRRNLTEFDANNCDVVSNVYHYDYQNISCCTPNWILNSTWSTCESTDIQYRNYYDSNYCNVSGQPETINQTCDYCTPNWFILNSSCSTQDNMTQSSTDLNDCYATTGLASDLIGYVPNQTTSCNYCTPAWQESDSGCQSSDLIEYTYTYTNTCCADTGLASDCTIPSDYNTTCDYCSTNWIIENTSCTTENNLTQYSYDSNSCYSTTGLASDLIGFVANQTFSCNYSVLSAPTITIISPGNSSTSSNDDINLQFSVVDNGAVLNCSIFIDNQLEQTYTNLTQATTYQISRKLSNSGYNWNVQCYDNDSFSSDSGLYYFTVSYTPSTGGGGGGGGGGGKPRAPPANSRVNTWTDVIAGSSLLWDIENFTVTHFSSDTTVNRSFVKVTITWYDSITDEPNLDNLYKFIELTDTNLEFTSAVVKFMIPKTENASKGLKLKYNKDGTWIDIPTVNTKNDAAYAYYETDITELGMYALYSDVIVSTPIHAPQEQSVPKDPDLPKPKLENAQDTQSEKSNSNPVTEEPKVTGHATSDKKDFNLGIQEYYYIFIGTILFIVTTLAIWHERHKIFKPNEDKLDKLFEKLSKDKNSSSIPKPKNSRTDKKKKVKPTIAKKVNAKIKTSSTRPKPTKKPKKSFLDVIHERR